MRKCIRALLCTVIAVTAVSVKADPASLTEGEYVGSIQGSADACKAIMPDAVKVGLEHVVSRLTAEGFDLAAYTGSDDYKKAYKEEVDRIRSLSVVDRQTSCEWQWGSYRAKAKPAAGPTVSRDAGQ